jgi:hypothetical protein
MGLGGLGSANGRSWLNTSPKTGPAVNQRARLRFAWQGSRCRGKERPSSLLMFTEAAKAASALHGLEGTDFRL